MVVRAPPTHLTSLRHFAPRSYMKAVCFPHTASVWGTGGRRFESSRSDHNYNGLAASRAKRTAAVVPAVVHRAALSKATVKPGGAPQADPSVPPQTISNVEES